VEPPGECWPDIKIINELAKRVGLDEYFWADEKEAFDLILSPSGLTFEELKKQRVLQAEMQYRKYEKAGFRTQSGKVEIYSQVLEGLGYSPLPVFNEPAETPYGSPELARDYPLVLTSAKEAYYYHSACRNIPRLRRIAPHPIARLNPETAAKLGLAEGDWVYIETKRGRIKQRLSLDRDLDPRVVVAAYGWWFPERGVSELHGWNESNINLLTENAPPYDPAVGSVNLRGILCRVSKA
jgi:anaerobic selenocysteine-containing dehydrogenase